MSKIIKKRKFRKNVKKEKCKNEENVQNEEPKVIKNLPGARVDRCGVRTLQVYDEDAQMVWLLFHSAKNKVNCSSS